VADALAVTDGAVRVGSVVECGGNHFAFDAGGNREGSAECVNRAPITQMGQVGTARPVAEPVKLHEVRIRAP
jgi:hypothetical protein